MIEVDFLRDDLWALLDPETTPTVLRIEAIIDSTSYYAFLEGRKEILNGRSTGIKIWGRSEQARLAERFSTSITDREDTAHIWQTQDATPLEIMDDITAKGYTTGISINWDVGLTDVKQGALTVENEFPIDVLKRLANAQGAELWPEIDGSITVGAFDFDQSFVTDYYGAQILELSREIVPSDRISVIRVQGYAGPGDAGEQVGSAQLQIDPQTDAPYYQGDTILVRIYRFHPLDALIITHTFPAGAVITPDVSGNEQAEEDVICLFGVCKTSRFDQKGLSEFIQGSLKDQPTGEVPGYEYATPYTDYQINTTLAPLGTNRATWYFEDGSARVDWDYEVLDPGTGPGYKDFTVKIIDINTEAIVPGAAIELDGTPVGTTDINGEITFPGLEIGSSHDILITKSGYVDSDLDDISNDSFVVK